MKQLTTLLTLIILLFGCSSINKKKAENMDYKFRDLKLEQNEIQLIESLSLKREKFYSLFSNIIISEIQKNSIKKDKKNRSPINGILFCGKKIDFEEISNLTKTLSSNNLILEVSINELSERYFDFKFPFYPNKDEVVDIKKQYYKIYKKDDMKDFITQIEYHQDDKTLISKVYNEWVEKINVKPIWADQNENVLYCPLELNDNVINIIYQGRLEYVESVKVNLEKKWVTEESLKESIRKDFPKIDFYFN